MKKIVSFSLYGNKPCYQVGAVLNVIEAARLLPDWKCRFYTTDNDTICRQLQFLGAEIVRMDDWPRGNMFWRFLAVDDADIAIIRDTDSIVSERENECLKQWLKSDCQWHVMRDHRLHNCVPILGGMWGFRRIEHNDPNKIDFRKRPMSDYIKEWRMGYNCSTAKHGKDQYFLKWLYEKYIRAAYADVFRHGRQGHPFPEHKQNRYTTHIGCSSFKGNTWNSGCIQKIEPPLELK